MSEEEYFKNRIDPQLHYYRSKSKMNKWLSMTCQAFELLASAALPVLAVILSDSEVLRYCIAILGMLIAIASGSTNIFKFREKWTAFRNAAEALKREQFLYKTQSGHFMNNPSFASFVERTEEIIGQEGSEWTLTVKSDDELQKLNQ